MRTLFALLTCLSIINLALADDDDDVKPSKPASNSDTSKLQLASATEKLAGIKTQALQATQQQAEFTAFGKVMNLEPLLQLRQQYLAANAQQQSAKARYTEAQLNLTRTQNLHSQDIVSSRRLQEQQAQSLADRANLDASAYQQQTLLENSKLEWGNTLSTWFTTSNHPQAEQFLKHSAQLIQITLPANSELGQGVSQIVIDAHGQRQNAIAATLISASPHIDPLTQGQRYFFKTQAKSLPYGSHITAWIAGHGKPTNGVLIPASAIVRQTGQSFVFIKTADGQFNRRPLPQLLNTPQGYLALDNVQVGEQVVISGAQTLLSEQLKSQIPDEDDD
mgnify:CR=1 FL=1